MLKKTKKITAYISENKTNYIRKIEIFVVEHIINGTHCWNFKYYTKY